MTGLGPYLNRKVSDPFFSMTRAVFLYGYSKSGSVLLQLPKFRPYRSGVPGVSTDPALPSVGPPLPREAAAVELVVVVVGRR